MTAPETPTATADTGLYWFTCWLADEIAEMDDSTEQLFGDYARIARESLGADKHALVVRHETHETPVVRITVERIA